MENIIENKQAKKGMSMKTTGFLLIGLAMILFIYQIGTGIMANYKFEKEIMYNWELADKSSTLDAKSQYITEFINQLERADLSEYNAIFLKTPDNNIEKNLDAVKTLRNRLNEIKDLDPESFAYQTAIQQITSQEQGEAMAMISVLRGGWNLGNGYYIIWGWILVLWTLIYMCVGCFGIYITYRGYEEEW